MEERTSANMYGFSFCALLFISSPSVFSVFSSFSPAPLVTGGDVTSSFSDFGTSFFVPKDFRRPMNEDSLAGSGDPGVSLGTFGVGGTRVSSPFTTVVLEK